LGFRTDDEPCRGKEVGGIQSKKVKEMRVGVGKEEVVYVEPCAGKDFKDGFKNMEGRELGYYWTPPPTKR